MLVRDHTWDGVLGVDFLGSRLPLLGIMACPKGKTQDGFELQLGTNHLCTYYTIRDRHMYYKQLTSLQPTSTSST